MLWLWQALMLEAFDLVFRAASQSLYVHESCRNSALLGSISCSRPSALVGGASWQSMLSTLKHASHHRGYRFAFGFVCLRLDVLQLLPSSGLTNACF